MSLWRTVGGFGPVVQMLLLNELTIFLGFFMLYPYLTGYFVGTLGMTSWMVGVILGVRAVSQQGMMLVGGTIADRLGYRPAIIGGLLFRSVGFALFGFADGFGLIMLAAILSGLAGAFFGPASRAYLATLTPGRRSDAFALSNVAAQTGTLFGPLIGIALLGVSFPIVAFTAAGLFAILGLVQLRFLPAISPNLATRNASVRQQLGEVVRNRRFVLFALAMFANFALFNQLYLALPLAVKAVTGSDGLAGLLFTITSLMMIFGQLPLTRWAEQHFGAPRSIAIGVSVMTLGFLPLLVVSLVGGASLPVWIGLLPIVAAAIGLGLGTMLQGPFAQAAIPQLARERFLATYNGAFQLSAAVGTLLANIVVGSAFDSGIPGLPWLAMLLLGGTSAAAVWVLVRFQILTSAPVAPASALAAGRTAALRR